MLLMIESMESRVLLTASVGVIEGDLAEGTAALKGAKADLKAGLKEAALDIKGFKADVKGVKLTPTQKAALTTLEKAEAKDAGNVSALVSKILGNGVARGAQLESALKGLVAHPTKTSAQLKVAAALVKLEAVFSGTVISNAEALVGADVTSLDTDLAAVGTAIPSTSGTVSTTQIDLSDDESTLAADATSITNVITTLATDLA